MFFSVCGSATWIEPHRARGHQKPDAEVEDPVTGPLGVKAVGGIGQVGSAAAIASAVYHATGYRPRELPIAAEHLLLRLPRRLEAVYTRHRSDPFVEDAAPRVA